jgi:phenylalanyl-tRNA synthetase beta chain
MEVAGVEADGRSSIALLRALLKALGHDDISLESGADLPGMHPGRSARVALAGEEIGVVGELSPSAARSYELPGRVAVAELDLEALVAPLERSVADSPSIYPFVDFDLSFVANDDLTAAEILESTTNAAGALLESADVFDEFRGGDLGDGERAIAITYRLRAADRTLTNEEVAPVRSEMIAAGESLGARLRGAG